MYHIDLLLVELCDVEYYRDLEIRVKDHSRSLKLVPFETLGAVSSLESFIPHLYLAPPKAVTPSEFREDVYDTRKTRKIGLPCSQFFMLSRFRRIPERDEQTEGRTDMQTDRIAISV